MDMSSFGAVSFAAGGVTGSTVDAAGGVTGPSAFVSVFGQGGASPPRAYVLQPVTESYCVAARRGGKQQEVNDWSVTWVLTDVPR